jgi:hypothetical protein
VLHCCCKLVANLKNTAVGAEAFKFRSNKQAGVVKYLGGIHGGHIGDVNLPRS